MTKRMDESTKRRVRAGCMLLSGKGPTEVAKVVGVARQTVHTWKGVLDEGGIDALRAISDKGRPAQLGNQQFEVLRRSLLTSPTEHGFGTELWTLKRIRLALRETAGRISSVMLEMKLAIVVKCGWRTSVKPSLMRMAITSLGLRTGILPMTQATATF